MLERVILREPRSFSETVSIRVDDDVDVIVVGEGPRGSVEGGIVEWPFRRIAGPDDPGDIASVGDEAAPAVLRGEVIRVPDAGLQGGRQRGYGTMTRSPASASNGATSI